MIKGLKSGKKYFIQLYPKDEYVLEEFVCEDDKGYLFRNIYEGYDIVVSKHLATLTKDKLRAITYPEICSAAIGKTETGGRLKQEEEIEMTENKFSARIQNQGGFASGLKKSKIFSPVLGRKPADTKSGDFA
ncbi:MAG: hypothetical protein PHQ66_03760 [Candidatus Nanoarchaeia archaeon]|nr:hypothetical protein [Candidatus Nanoarchaeia archaeon]MDD5358201.1 hypothetical protein [Candidatus Nanoarchaeia archaeon]MDD5588441.1 hypothetical protein [Candidatus Nanoarchaeia archaeon]